MKCPRCQHENEAGGHCTRSAPHPSPQMQQAQEHLTTATTMYRGMGMTYWLEQAEAELQLLA